MKVSVATTLTGEQQSELGRVYMHLQAIGDADECASVLKFLRPVLKEMYARGEIRGYRLFVIKDQDEAEEELLHYFFDYQSVTRGAFPFVYAGLQAAPSVTISLDDRMLEHGFRRFR